MSILNTIAKTEPRKLFLLDGIGAFFSAAMLGLVLSSFENFFGIPPTMLYFLAGIACLFCIHSLTHFVRKAGNWRNPMKIIAVANLAYLLLTMALAIYYYAEIKAPGILYFILECIVILVLSRIELAVAYHPAGENA